MNPFEFVTGFYSVVLGVAVAQLMTGVGRLVEERDRVRTYWVHSVWILNVLLVDIDNWWSLWIARDARTWNIYTFSTLIALVGLVYLSTVLLFPRMSGDGELDLRAHYYKSSRIFFAASAAGWLLAIVCNWTLFPITLLDAGVIAPALVAGLAVGAAITPNRVYHACFAVFTLAMVLVLLTGPGWRL